MRLAWMTIHFTLCLTIAVLLGTMLGKGGVTFAEPDSFLLVAATLALATIKVVSWITDALFRMRCK